MSYATAQICMLQCQNMLFKVVVPQQYYGTESNYYRHCQSKRLTLICGREWCRLSLGW